MCRENCSKCFILKNQFKVDNGAMIAWLGLKEYKDGKRQNIKNTEIKPYWRTDEV